jgi:putative FmdB family regulatory protein
MPIFEFQCSKCDCRFEKYQSGGGESGKVECPQCGGKKVEKVFSLFSAQCASGSTGTAPAGGCGSGGFS